MEDLWRQPEEVLLAVPHEMERVRRERTWQTMVVCERGNVLMERTWL